MLPNQVEHAWHIGGLAGDCDHCILVRHDDCILAKRAVAPVAIMTAPPELVAITLVPITLLLCLFEIRRGLLDLETRGFFHPCGWKQPFPIPLSFQPVQFAELGESFRLNFQPPTTGIDT